MFKWGLPLLLLILFIKFMALAVPDTESLGQLATWVATIFVFGATVFEKIRTSKAREKVSQSSDLLSEAQMWRSKAEVMQKASTENFALYQAEREEHQKTREFWHNKSGEFQATLGKCQEQLQTANGRPDLSEILHRIEEQSRTQLEILGYIRTIVNRLNLPNPPL